MTQRQEGIRKDVERFFGCLQGRFHILRHERFEWSDEEVIRISQVCVIPHNMILDMDRRGELVELDGNGSIVIVVSEFESDHVVFRPGASNEATLHALSTYDTGFLGLLERAELIRDDVQHRRLREALTDHVWARKGTNA